MLRRSNPDASLVVFGSSSTEAFDYLFGSHDRYHPFWASGWSARSLGRPQVQDYVFQLLAGVRAPAQIVLAFGMQDLMFGLPAALRAAGYSGVVHCDDPEAARLAEVSVASAILGQVALMRALRAAGYGEATAFFWAPPPDLPADYWVSRGLPALPPAFIGQLYRSMGPRMRRHKVQVLDVTDQFGGALLQPTFARSGAADHHPDYIRCQRALWAALQPLQPVLPKRRYWRRRAWGHERVMIGDLLATGLARPRTCR
ncbi:hypothetical protein [Ketogulonicigenium robustum]|uniref:hypothetical protein n=1 Tax=Ketogulonicigenium robustum TaxID=92947 RepID=UPI0012F4F046|nr:hypothetical protein [Ketogulonicigenium robustum]